RPIRQRSYKEMDAEQDALENEAVNFMLPGRGEREVGDIFMGPDGNYYGKTQPRGQSDGHRWWRPQNPIENYEKASNDWNNWHDYGGYGGYRPRPQEPIHGMAEDV